MKGRLKKTAFLSLMLLVLALPLACTVLVPREVDRKSVV